MNTNPAIEYYIQKKALLKQCLTLSEELISSLEDWESLSDILERREAMIEQLKEFEAAAGNRPAFLTQEMKLELDQMIRLIQNLDQDSISLMRKEQQDIMASLKANTQGQKLIQYTPDPRENSGRILDYKK